MKRNNNRSYYIIALFAVVLSLGIGYALFSETLNITGTATTTGSFDLEFYSATVGTPTSYAGTPSATISGDKNTLTLAADTLTQPGAIVTYDVTIKNVSSLNAELTNVVITGNTDPDLTVTVTPSFATGTFVNAGASYNFSITVEWPIGSIEGNKTINYTVTLDYQQAE